MKRYINTIFAGLAIAALAFSCAKETPAPTPEDPDSGKIIFQAYAAQTRTTVENGAGSERIVKWAAGDEIKIWYAADASVTANAATAGTSTSFEVEGLGAASDYYASYPSGISAFDGTDLSVTVPAAQDGNFASANMSVATTPAGELSLHFYNVTSLVKFDLAGAGYTKAVFCGANGEDITGIVPVTFDKDGLGVVTGVTPGAAASAGSSVEVTVSGTGTYYFSILPQTLADGYMVQLYKGSSLDETVSMPHSINFAKGTIVYLGSLDGKSVSDFFATPSGAGNKTGRNWDNAFDAAALKAFLDQPVDGGGDQIDDAALAKAAVLDGATIHMAAGDYDFAGEAKIEFSGYASQVGITFKGGYPAGLAGTSVAERDTTTYRSAITSSVAGSIITLGDQTNVSFEGITFKGATRAVDGGALMADAESGDCSLTLTSCRFINNANTDDYTGAGVYIKKGSATISECYFASNYARNGSCINLDAGNGTVSISDCLFEYNTTFNTSACVQNGSTKTVSITDCTFDHNTAGSYGGGAFHTNASGASTTFSGCTFSNNSAGQGGAISIQKGSAAFTNCSFTGNTATKGSKSDTQETDDDLGAYAGGAIILHDATSVCTLNSCTFTNNSAPNGSGGAIAYESVAATLNVNAGTSFSGNTAYNHGGAIYVRGAGKLFITGESASKVNFTDNKTLATGNQHANGGAIWLGASSQTTMSYAVFDGCEAGKEDGSTVNYSNGGAISIKTVNSFSASNCEFTACRGRNGGVLNVELGSGKTATFTNCDFHDNVGRSGASKDGTSGNFHGAVARFGGSGTTTFNTCSFTDNVAYNGGGALHSNTANTVVCNNCSFSNNDSNSSGGSITWENGTLTISGGTVSEGDSGTGQGGMLYFIKGTLNLNNTTVSGCKSASAKSGGAIQVYTGGTYGGAVTINATGTTFSDNQCGSYSDDAEQGGAIRTEGASGKVITINLTDCLFSGNKAKRFGTAISLNKYCFLKADRCVFSGNVGKSRGTVNYGDNSLIFMNNCAFYNNTFSDATTWGLTVHGGGANAGICLNNLTAYNNRSTNGSPSTTSNVSVNGDSPMLIVNSTILDNTAFLLRANGRTLQFCNNILVNPGTAANIVHSNTGTKTSYGHNIMSGTSAADDVTDLTSCTMSTLTSGAWSSNTASSPYYGVYSWTGGASLPGFTPAVESDVTDAIAAYTQAVSGVGVSNAGTAFKEWLDSLSPKGYQADGRSVTREGTMWPGAYQQN
ncbi:MAG: hypothetical protein K6F58_05045 [Bacteroidales bacterium]|nr:hypothetical protein [Bacteroidales bacterium]